MIKKHIEEPWFSYIKLGKKIIEIRLNKGLFIKLKENDVIVWYNKNRICKTKIIKRYDYKSFTELFENHRIFDILPFVKDKKEALKIYRKYYNEEDEKSYGVVGFYCRLI